MKKKSLFYLLMLISPVINIFLLNGMAILVWIVFVPFFLNIILFYKEKKEIILHGAFFSLVTLISGFFWIFEYKSHLFFLAMVLFTAFFVLFSLTYSYLYSLILKLLKKVKNSTIKVIGNLGLSLLAPVIWGVLLLLFPIFGIGGSYFFEYGLFIFNAAWLSTKTGLFGITIFIILFNSILAFIIKKIYFERKHKFKKKQLISLIIILFSIFFILNSNSLFTEKEAAGKTEITIAAIQPNFDQGWNWRRENAEGIVLETDLNLTKLAVEQGAEIVVWPEFALPIDIMEFRQEAFETIKQFAKDNQVNLIIGTPIDRFEEKYLDAALYINSEGEYLSYYASGFPGFFTGNVISEHKIETFSFFINNQEVKIGTIICYEEFYDLTAREMKTANADLLVALVNNHEVRGGIWQASLYSRYRASENGLPLVRSANTGISQIIDKNGKLLDKLDENKEGFVIQKILI